jgi:hypothetical protein
MPESGTKNLASEIKMIFVGGGGGGSLPAPLEMIYQCGISDLSLESSRFGVRYKCVAPTHTILHTVQNKTKWENKCSMNLS